MQSRCNYCNVYFWNTQIFHLDLKILKYFAMGYTVIIIWSLFYVTFKSNLFLYDFYAKKKFSWMGNSNIILIFSFLWKKKVIQETTLPHIIWMRGKYYLKLFFLIFIWFEYGMIKIWISKSLQWEENILFNYKLNCGLNNLFLKRTLMKQVEVLLNLFMFTSAILEPN